MVMERIKSSPQTQGPFANAESDDYRRWREAKISTYPINIKDIFIDIANAENASPAEREKALSIVQCTNVFLYRTNPTAGGARAAAHALARTFGLNRLDSNLCAEDGLSEIAVRPAGATARYIPYTDRPIQWHTDGYYNAPDRRIRGFLLHCESDAAQGGESVLMDHEIAYILLRDQDPALVEVLLHPEAMTVPANEDDGRELRGVQAGPVFSRDLETGALHMRYTARTRSIVWRDDPATRAAAARLRDIMSDPASPYVIRHRLGPGEGVICNNVLHGRAAFQDDPASGKRRRVWRARSYDRVS